MGRFLVILALFLFLPILSHAECDKPAVWKFCDNSPFSPLYVISPEEAKTIKECSNFSTTYKFLEDEMITKKKLDQFCKGTYHQ